MEMTTLIIYGSFLTLCAIVAGIFARKMAARTLRDASASIDTAESVRRHAQNQREMILEEALAAAREQFSAEAERLEEERAVIQRIQTEFEQELNTRQSELDREFHQLTVKDQGLEERLQQSQRSYDEVRQVAEKRAELQNNLISQLEQKTSSKKEDVQCHIGEEILNAEKLGISRWLLEQNDVLKTDAQRFAKDVLTSVLSRYSPTFVWPKSSFTVELPRKDLIERYFGDGSPLVGLLVKDTMTNIETMVEGEEVLATLKISGGAGVDKEVIRLTLEEVVAKNLFASERVIDILEKHRRNVDRLVLRMGTDAMKILDLPLAHPEILKLIGSLNFRTSHRQNQYYHTLEVARLAGMLADEVGVDRRLAKRSGLLHDIGKVLDYKIEGSHAVISGDYASRFGEKEDVVDTVLSHHDDKIVETPFAYILKAADAMSGARPGARVDMEEGYQKRIESIVEVIRSFEGRGIVNSAIMSAGREVHIFVDNHRIKERDTQPLAVDIAKKLETDVEYPGQIKVTIIRRTEVSEVA